MLFSNDLFPGKSLLLRSVPHQKTDVITIGQECSRAIVRTSFATVICRWSSLILIALLWNNSALGAACATYVAEPGSPYTRCVCKDATGEEASYVFVNDRTYFVTHQVERIDERGNEIPFGTSNIPTGTYYYKNLTGPDDDFYQCYFEYSPGFQTADSYALRIDQQIENFASEPAIGTFGGTATASAIGGDSGNPVVFASATPAKCNVSGENGMMVNFVSAGVCSITANQAGDDDYFAAIEVTLHIDVSEATQEITGFSSSSETGSVGGSSTLTASGGGSGNPVVFSSATVAICNTTGTNGSAVNFLTPGTCVVHADQAGNANYHPAPQQSIGIAVDSTDLGVGIGNGLDILPGGEFVQYFIVVRNHGPMVVTAATVDMLLPDQLSNVSWSCNALAGATCTSSGVGAIADVVDLPVSASIEYFFDAFVQADPEESVQVLVVTSVPSGFVDQVPGNDSDLDDDYIGVFGDDFAINE